MYEDEILLVFRERQNKSTMVWKLKITAIIFLPSYSYVDAVRNESFERWLHHYGGALMNEIELQYDPATPLLGIHTEETRSKKDTCTLMFITSLFVISRIWKQPRCPWGDEWIRKLWYIYTMGYYSDIKKNSFESVLMRWMKLEPIMQSEVIQKDKHQYSILMHIYGILKDGNDNPICKTEKRDTDV